LRASTAPQAPGNARPNVSSISHSAAWPPDSRSLSAPSTAGAASPSAPSSAPGALQHAATGSERALVDVLTDFKGNKPCHAQYAIQSRLRYTRPYQPKGCAHATLTHATLRPHPAAGMQQSWVLMRRKHS